MKNIVSWFKNEESGQGMVEYALIIGLISVGAIAVLVVIGPKIANMFSNVNSKI